MGRPSISDSEFNAAVAAVPAPAGFVWVRDPAAGSDRVRLFGDAEPPGFRGEVCQAYPSGDWCVRDPTYTHQNFGAQGEEVDLQEAMVRALKVAIALGWELRA